MNPDRPIEKLLQAFARKRRDQADKAFELHPATRRMLQGEVARQYGRAGGKPARGRWSWTRFWPRLAFVTAATAVLVVAAVLLVPPGQKPSKTLARAKGEAAAPASGAPAPKPTAAPVAERQLAARPPAAAPTQSADQRLAAAPVPAMAPSESAPTLVNKLEPATTTPRPEALALADKAKPSDSVLNAPATPAPVVPEAAPSSPAASVSLAEERPASLAAGAKDASALRDNRAKTELAPQVALADSQAAAQPVGRFGGAAVVRRAGTVAASKKPADGKQAGSAGAWAFDRTAQRQYFANQTVASARSRQQPDAAQTVLNSFQLEQRGPEIRIVDADGSVYTGTVQFADALRPAGTMKTKALPAPTLRSPKAQESAYGGAKPAGVLPATAPSVQFLNFTVRGTNATLRQAVEFVGNLQPAPAVSQLAPGNQAQNRSALQQNQFPTQRPPQNPLASSRITGRARLANGAELEINAVPQAADAGAPRK